MPYCRKCGAYIPEGWDSCPSCGESEKEKQTGGAQAQAQASTERDERDYGYDVRKSVEDYLRNKRQESREWAKQEYERRKSSYEQSSFRTEGKGNKLLSVLSYFSGFFVLPFLVKSDTPENKSVRFHAKQGGILFVASLLARAVTGIFHVRWLARIATVLLAIKGADNAANDKDEPLPYIGRLF